MILQPLTHQWLPCLVTANQVPHQRLMPNKPNCPVLPQSREGIESVVYPFSEEEYRKGIAALKNGKEVGIDDVLVEQFKSLGLESHKWLNVCRPHKTDLRSPILRNELGIPCYSRYFYDHVKFFKCFYLNFWQRYGDFHVELHDHTRKHLWSYQPLKILSVFFQIGNSFTLCLSNVMKFGYTTKNPLGNRMVIDYLTEFTGKCIFCGLKYFI